MLGRHLCSYQPGGTLRLVLGASLKIKLRSLRSLPRGALFFICPQEWAWYIHRHAYRPIVYRRHAPCYSHWTAHTHTTTYRKNVNWQSAKSHALKFHLHTATHLHVPIRRREGRKKNNKHLLFSNIYSSDSALR